MRKLLIIFAVIFSAAIAHGQQALSQSGNEQGENITMSPAVMRPDFVPGDEYKGRVRVINNGKIDYTFIVYSRPFSVEGESYKADFEKVNKYTEAYQWVHFERSRFELKSGQSVDVPFTVRVPEDARPGGHYAVIFAETQTKEGVSVARKKRVGGLVYATARGDYVQKGSIESFDSNTWFKKPPVSASLLVRNDGNVHFDSTSVFEYKSVFGKVVHSDKQTRTIMPGTTRKIDVQWEKPPLFGVYKLRGEVTILGKSEQIVDKYIILMPYWLLAIVLVLPLILVAARILRNKK